MVFLPLAHHQRQVHRVKIIRLRRDLECALHVLGRVERHVAGLVRSDRAASHAGERNHGTVDAALAAGGEADRQARRGRSAERELWRADECPLPIVGIRGRREERNQALIFWIIEPDPRQ